MREISFRVWDKKEQRMYHFPSSIVLICDYESARLVFGDDFHDNFSVYSTANIEIMQYTGTKDSEGQKIYDGDIIKITGMYGKIQYAKVIWGPVKNMYTWMNGETWLLHFSEGIEGPLYPYCQRHHGYEVSVAGNIYENTELLKEGKIS